MRKDFLQSIGARQSELTEAEAVLRPGGLVGTIVAGYFILFPPSYPTQVFTELPPALKYLGLSSQQGARWKGRVDQARAIAPELKQLRGVLSDQVALDLAQAARTLQRKLKDLGTSFQSELDRARLEVAERLIAETDEKLNAVAAQVGFASYPHFSVWFHQKTFPFSIGRRPHPENRHVFDGARGQTYTGAVPRPAWFAIAALLALTPVAGHAAPTPKAAAKKKPKPKPKPGTPPEPEPAPAPEPATDAASTAPAAAPAVAAPPPSDKPVVESETAVKPPAPAAAPASREEEVVDFDAEEKKLDQRMAPVMPPTNGAGGPPGRPPPGDTGYKLIVDLLLKHTVGTQSLSFTPNHTLVILMVNISERANLQLNIAPDPAFYELSFAITKDLIFKVGKMLVPFGTNNYHHILGGRVDEQSQFLPETWATTASA